MCIREKKVGTTIEIGPKCRNLKHIYVKDFVNKWPKGSWLKYI